MQGEDEPTAKKQDILDMTAASAPTLGPETPAPLGGRRNHPLAPHVQEQIGRRLAAVYDEVLRQPIPERFLLLLDQLDEMSRTTNARPPAKETKID